MQPTRELLIRRHDDTDGAMLTRTVLQFGKKNRRLPEVLVMYREGVSEGQFDAVQRTEILQVSVSQYRAAIPVFYSADSRATPQAWSTMQLLSSATSASARHACPERPRNDGRFRREEASDVQILFQIRAACLDMNKDYRPPVTFLVVQKRCDMEH